MMDYVPKTQRARWRAMESVTELNWCGSALVGGILADRYSYASTFLITAAMQLMGSMVYWALLPVVPMERTMTEEAYQKPNQDRGPQRPRQGSGKGVGPGAAPLLPP